LPGGTQLLGGTDLGRRAAKRAGFELGMRAGQQLVKEVTPRAGKASGALEPLANFPFGFRRFAAVR
jgi:hypothetical protein